MSDDLFTLLREHDLPPRWDGYVVQWRGWEAQDTSGVFICPPPRKPSCCEGCGSLTSPVMNVGYVARRVDSTLADVEADNAAAERLPVRVRHKYKRKHPALLRLWVWRCPDCRLDVVWDHDTGEWWTLDHTDYGDEGST